MNLEKFWMIKGSLGAPVVIYHDLDTARARAVQVARESGKLAFVLEAVAVAVPEIQQIRDVEMVLL